MQFSTLEVGLMILVAGEPARVIKCTPPSEVEVLRLKDKRRFLVPVDNIVLLPPAQCNDSIVPIDNFMDLLESASSKEIKTAEERFLAISQYLSKEITIEMAVSVCNVGKARFYQILRTYDENIGIASLLPKRKGRKKGESKISAEVEALIQRAIDKKRVGKGLTYAKVWSEVRFSCVENHEPIPSIGTVTARIKKLDGKTLHAKRFGSEAAAQVYGAKPGAQTTTGPLAVAQIDHTLVDIILCDEESRIPIGRPWLTVVIDVHTRVLLGYYIGFNAPSAVSVACAITHAAFPKQHYLKQIGLESSDVLYPFYGVPKVLQMDNAVEFRSLTLERACSIYGIKTEFRPPGKKHYGGAVERLIGTLMTSNVHFLSGTTFSNVQQRKGYHSERKSVLSLREFAKWFAGQVVIYHATMHRGIKQTPGDCWNKAFANADGSINMPPLIHEPLRFRLNFMPSVRRSISPKGIAFRGRYYWSPGFNPFVGTKNVLIKFDPLSLLTIWVELNGEYVVANYSDLTGSHLSLEEHLLRAGNSKKLAWISEEAVAKTYQQNETLIQGSARTTKKIKKQAAAIKEYQKYLTDVGQKSGKEFVAEDLYDDNLDYSKKPRPYTSEDV
ncbi:Mu transposase C-terminal domain-containing protein [Pseudomonas mandelii]|uniref:Mu transposase C-terminal domain-containing protein n=1 Tax=Pseudomonas mandelii TaxID=75612 RepID=UPI00398CCB4D